MFFLYIIAALCLYISGARCIKLCRSMTKTMYRQRDRIMHIYSFCQIYNMILFYTSQSLWKQVYMHELHFHSQLSINRNTIKYSLAYLYSCHSATYSKCQCEEQQREKKGNLTDCVSSVRFSNSIRAVVIMDNHYERLWLFIAQVTIIHHVPVNYGNVSVSVIIIKHQKDD